MDATHYKPEYCDLTDYLAKRKEQGKLPTICGYAVYLGKSEMTIHNWKNENPEFKDALEKLMALQKDILINKGLSKTYDSTITKLMLSHNHQVREKTELDIGGQKDNPLSLVMFKDVLKQNDDTE